MRRGTMKRTTAVIAAVLLLVAGALPALAAEYKDGVYVAVSDATNHGYLMAVVMIQGGKIAQVRLTEMNGFGDPKPATYPWEPYHEAMKVLPGMFVEANSWEIDAIAQATGTSTSAMTAVRRALEKASGTGTGKYFDGTFFGRSPADDHGYGTALVTIENDRIVAVELAEVMPDGTWKDFATYPWEPTMQAKAELEAKIVETQSFTLDAVSGATHSSEKWMKAVENALKSAER